MHNQNLRREKKAKIKIKSHQKTKRLNKINLRFFLPQKDGHNEKWRNHTTNGTSCLEFFKIVHIHLLNGFFLLFFFILLLYPIGQTHYNIFDKKTISLFCLSTSTYVDGTVTNITKIHTNNIACPFTSAINLFHNFFPFWPKIKKKKIKIFFYGVKQIIETIVEEHSRRNQVDNIKDYGEHTPFMENLVASLFLFF